MKNYKAYNDCQLSAMLKDGDRDAYTEIYGRYKRPLYLFAFKRLGNKEDVSDAIHEVFLSLWINHESLVISYTLSTYLHSAIRNKVANLIAHKQVQDRYLQSFSNFLSTSYDSSDHLVRHRELEIQIEKEIQALPVKMREIFELSRKFNHNRSKIAKDLGLSEETVKSQLYQALKRLKTKFGSWLIMLL